MTHRRVLLIATAAVATALVLVGQHEQSAPAGQRSLPQPSATPLQADTAIKSGWSALLEEIESKDLGPKLNPLGADIESEALALLKDPAQAEALLRRLASFVARGVDCLQKESDREYPCGQEPDPGRPFYARDATPLHESINRALQLELAMAQATAEKGTFPRDAYSSVDELRRGLETFNSETQVQSAGLMAVLDGMDVAASHVLDVASQERLTPQAESQLLEFVSTSLSPSLRPKLLDRVSTVLSSEDPDRFFELLDRLGSIPMSREELLRSARPLCAIQGNAALAHNQIAVQRRFEQASQRLGAHATWQDLCSG